YFAASALLFATTLSLPRGIGHWLEFRENLQRHMQNIAYNSIGLTEILAYRHAEAPTTPETYDATVSLRGRLAQIQLFTALLLAAVLVWWRSRGKEELAAFAMAPLLLFVSLDLAAYYYVFLLVLLLASRDEPRRLACLFLVEVASYFLQLFEDRDSL